MNTVKDKTDCFNEILEHGISNMDYFIIGTYQGKRFLEAYDVFNAMEKIREYETDHFGECTTDLGCPEKVANMLAYIVGEEILAECETVGCVGVVAWIKRTLTQSLRK